MGFPDDVGYPPEAGAELLRIIRHSSRVLDEPCHSTGIQWAGAFLARERRQIGSKLPGTLGTPIHLIIEVRRHLEQLVEFFIILTKQVVKAPVADQDHLGIQWNGLGFQR